LEKIIRKPGFVYVSQDDPINGMASRGHNFHLSVRNRSLDQNKIRDLVFQGKYEFTKHAERERELDMISMGELENALRTCEIIEDYPDDPRGASCLVLGFWRSKHIHVVCTIKTDPEELLLITVYDPSKRPDKWTNNYRTRR
jgi:hypothetical protein